MGETTKDWVGWAARLLLGQRQEARTQITARVGELELADFQQRAAAQLVDTFDVFNGALLADATGLGKTRIALAAAWFARRRAPGSLPIACCVPARLRGVWRRAAVKAGFVRQGDVVWFSHSELSRGRGLEPGRYAAVLVDEAHRFRNRSTRRYARLAEVTHSTPTLLITATPLCNGLDDLRALLELFVQDEVLRHRALPGLAECFELARRGDSSALEVLLSRLVVRRLDAPSGHGFGRRPRVELEVIDYVASEPERWVWQNLGEQARLLTLALLESRWPRQLFIEFLLRRWESGPEALLETLQKLALFHRRWLEQRERGHVLSRADSRALFERKESIAQELLPFMFTRGVAEVDVDDARADLELLDALIARVEEARRFDSRIENLVALLDELGGRKLLVFVGYVDAADGLFDALRSRRPLARVGIVHGRGARMTGVGEARFEEVLDRFAPIGCGAEQRFDEHETLQVLIATDCLAHGVSLQDCGAVLLCDLPYSPLGVEQRIGRLLRPGGPHEQVQVYLPRPADWQDSLGMRRRLSEKLDEAERAGLSMPAADVVARGAPDAVEEVFAGLERFDQLLHLYAGGGAPARAKFWRAGACVDAAVVVVSAVIAGERHEALVMLSQEGRREGSACVRELVKLADAEIDASAVDALPDEVAVWVDDFLLERADELDRITCAPRSSPLIRAQVSLLGRLRAGLLVVPRELSRRLRRPLSPGIVAQLEALAADERSIEALVEELDALLPRAAPPSRSRVELELVLAYSRQEL